MREINECIYVSSSGEQKDVRDLDYQYLVNAIAKAYRNLNECTTKEEFFKNNDNINVLHEEILIRNKNYYNNVLLGGE